MAVVKPLFINQVEYDAESERRGFAGLVAQSSAGVARTGVLGPSPSVSLSGSTVKVGALNAVVGTAKGAYLVAVDSVTDAGTLGVADATNGRLDRVVLEVLDPDNGSGGTVRVARLRVIAGTAAAIPGLPALPPLALHVAQVLTPRAGGGSPVVTVDAPLTAAAGAPVPVRSQAERDVLTPVAGQLVQRLDKLGTIEVGTGTGWMESGPAIRQGFTAGRSDGEGWVTVTYSTPMPTSTYVAVPASMNPPEGGSILQFITGTKTGATFRAFALNGAVLRNQVVGVGYIAVGF